MHRCSVEPCHPLGFWGRDVERRVNESGFSSPYACTRFLELNACAQLDASIGKGADLASVLARDLDLDATFLLDDVFASKKLMDLMSPERVADVGGCWVLLVCDG